MISISEFVDVSKELGLIVFKDDSIITIRTKYSPLMFASYKFHDSSVHFWEEDVDCYTIKDFKSSANTRLLYEKKKYEAQRLDNIKEDFDD